MYDLHIDTDVTVQLCDCSREDAQAVFDVLDGVYQLEDMTAPSPQTATGPSPPSGRPPSTPPPAAARRCGPRTWTPRSERRSAVGTTP